jgi:hypothetical protein
MSWIIGYRTVRMVQTFERRHGRPPRPYMRRVVEYLPVIELAHAIPRAVMCLPERRTDTAPSSSAIAWSIRYLIEPLQAYYARYAPPLRYGLSIAPGHRGARQAMA